MSAADKRRKAADDHAWQYCTAGHGLTAGSRPENLEPGPWAVQSRFHGPAWLGPLAAWLARLAALGRATHITKFEAARSPIPHRSPKLRPAPTQRAQEPHLWCLLLQTTPQFPLRQTRPPV